MSDYSAVAPPQQNFNQSSAFAAALQRAKQIAAKINPGGGGGAGGGGAPGGGNGPSVGGGGSSEIRQKRPHEDGSVGEPDAKKLASSSGPPSLQGSGPGRPSQQNQGPPNMGGPPGMGGGPGQFNVAEENIKVPDKMVGLIIGRGGEQITRLQAESGCKIQMAPDSGQPERVCSLSGSREAINRAKELIMNIVHQRGRSEGIQGLDLGPGMGQGNFGSGADSMEDSYGARRYGPLLNNPRFQHGPGGLGGGNQGMGGGGGGGGGPGRNFVEIMVPGPKVGLIIGKGGETIKQLQERSGAKMVVIQDGPNQEQEKPLRISGDPQKVEYAKQLVYDLIAEKEMQAYNRGGRGGGGGGNRYQQDDRQGGGGGYGDNYGGGGGGGNNEVEVLVPKAAVGVVIGKGGDMIKKIQAETGARVQFQQARDEGPGDRRCYLSGKPMNVEQARQRIEELIDSVHRRDGDNNGGGPGGPGGPGGNRGGGRGGGRGGRGGGDFDGGRGNRNGGPGGNSNQEYGGGGWDDRRSQQAPPQEVTFTVPSYKCGVIIGKGGETIKQINQQSGAHCELDRRNQNQNSTEKSFIIRGETDQIEIAKRIISDKVQMPINFVNTMGGGQTGGNNMGNNLPTAYPGMAPQGYNPQGGWGVPAYQQQWGGPTQPTDSNQSNASGVSMNSGAGQPDYSLQWAEYYRSLGMHREAEMIEQQAKTKGGSGGGAPTSGAPSAGAGAPPSTNVTPAPAAAGVGAAANGAQSQPDYSAQWAEYYRSLGKVKEAEAIEAQMKVKQGSGANPAVSGNTAGMPGNPGAPNPAAAYQQQPYGAYQAPGGYYGGQPSAGGPQGVPQGQYGFPGYGYTGGPAPPSSGGQEQNQ